MRVLDRRQGNRNRQGDARRAGTCPDTRPIIAAGGGADVPGIPEVGSDRSGAAVPRGMPGTLLWKLRCRIPSRTTRASPKRSDAWLAEAMAVTGTLAFRCPPRVGRGPDRPDRQEGNTGAGGDGAERWMECRRTMNRRKLAGRGWREAVAVIRRDARTRRRVHRGRKAFSGGRKQ